MAIKHSPARGLRGGRVGASLASSERARTRTQPSTQMESVDRQAGMAWVRASQPADARGPCPSTDASALVRGGGCRPALHPTPLLLPRAVGAKKDSDGGVRAVFVRPHGPARVGRVPLCPPLTGRVAAAVEEEGWEARGDLVQRRAMPAAHGVGQACSAQAVPVGGPPPRRGEQFRRGHERAAVVWTHFVATRIRPGPARAEVSPTLGQIHRKVVINGSSDGVHRPGPARGGPAGAAPGGLRGAVRARGRK